MKKLLLPVLLAITHFALAQNTVGVLSYDFANTFPGYNLFYPYQQADVFLIDNCGRLVNRWEGDTLYTPNSSAYLLEDGSMLKTATRGVDSNPYIHAPGGGELIQKYNWEGELTWEFSLNDSLYRIHHDIEPMPNGNVLAVAWEAKTEAEAVAAGRDPNLLTEDRLWPDFIVEIQPIGADSGIIVWEWHVWDHLIQDFDPAKENYGVIADHPGRININYTMGDGVPDWLHINAIDYNPNLDQIVVSVPFFDEIWIIDHNTTTAQAAGPAGDLIYRWGNPAVYDRGGPDDQQLFFQHNAHWMDIGLGEEHPDYGKLIVYNNRLGEDFSGVYTWTPDYDLPTGEAYGPEGPEWEYVADPPQSLFSPIVSGAQRLPNRNTLICAGRHGYIQEVDLDGNVVWEYESPIVMGVPANQGDTLPVNANIMFRFNRYPENYPGLADKDLTPIAYLEGNPAPELCPLEPLSAVDVPKSFNYAFYPNPVTSMAIFRMEDQKKGRLALVNVLGARMWEQEVIQGENELDLGGIPNGFYWLALDGFAIERILIQR